MSLLPAPPIWLSWCYIYWFIYSFIYQGLGMCTAGSCGGQRKICRSLVLDIELRSSVWAGGTFILWAILLPSPFSLLRCLLETVSLFSPDWCWTQDCSVLAPQILRLQVSYHLSLLSLIVYYHLAHVQQSSAWKWDCRAHKDHWEELIVLTGGSGRGHPVLDICQITVLLFSRRRQHQSRVVTIVVDSAPICHVHTCSQTP